MTTPSYPPSLSGSALDYTHADGPDLLQRLDAGYDWCEARLADGFDSYQRCIDGPVGAERGGMRALFGAAAERRLSNTARSSRG